MTKDPVQEKKKESTECIFCGGGWNSRVEKLSVPNHYSYSPGFRGGVLGLRLVRNVKEKE
jgi:hypothetical protein